jgi:hypothetical protein
MNSKNVYHLCYTFPDIGVYDPDDVVNFKLDDGRECTMVAWTNNITGLNFAFLEIGGTRILRYDDDFLINTFSAVNALREHKYEKILLDIMRLEMLDASVVIKEYGSKENLDKCFALFGSYIEAIDQLRLSGKVRKKVRYGNLTCNTLGECLERVLYEANRMLCSLTQEELLKKI